jgi:hypothetical protein
MTRAGLEDARLSAAQHPVRHPRMQGPELAATVERPLVLELTGPGATTATVLPAAEKESPLTVQPGAHGTTRIRSTALDFIN